MDDNVARQPAFDLVHDPWIPVVTGGHAHLVSLRDCLVNAHEIDTLATAAPLETVAVLRQVLVPVYLDAHFAGPGVPLPPDEDAWNRHWQAGQLDAERIDA